MKYAILGSGSSANSYIFEHDGFAFVVDNGFSLREFTARSESMGFDISAVKFIFLTHRHIDHSRGIGALSKKLKIPVVMCRDVSFEKTESKRIYKRLDVEPGRSYSYSGLDFSVFPISHDSPGSVSYSFTIAGYTFTLITDTGIILKDMEKHALKSDILFLEANYCPVMLEEGPYPVYLKKRIDSEHGHLSNNAAVEFLSRLYLKGAGKTRMTYLCHLSDTNNCCEKLEYIIKSIMPGTFRYRVCRKGEPVPGISLCETEEMYG